MNKGAVIALTAVVALGAGFYGGAVYGKKQALTPAALQSLSQEQRQQLLQGFRGGAAGGGAFAGRTGGGRQGGGQVTGGFISGEVLSRDDQRATVKGMDGSSRIVFFSSSTEVSMSVAGSVSELTAGQQVTVAGSQNSDGSLTARSIQIRPSTQNR